MSVTAVPLRPIKPGSVRRFWLVMVLLFAVAIVLAWAGSRQFGQMPSGLRYQMLVGGTGASPTKDDFALIDYKRLGPDGAIVEENKAVPMELANTVPGFSEGVTLLKKGGTIRLWVPPALGYGANPPENSGIAPNSPLQFEIKLIDFKTHAEVMEQQRAMQLQQMMQQQQQQGGGAAPGGPGAGAPEGALPPGMEGPPPGAQ